ncbi:siphovirus Gp157 family protein [Bradyrhizobium liaoningense]|uniref:siphovirus Gp157 family protein n=1 Tax=Bradyrhizobium liaoningense TaxID=43992 RepID=UPI001BAA5889|nr:siphovirus Gp157 family protein [Bradyrhizobium liaoningense]MBR0741194.1 siphovirus Gp157 family protein [Bradyrhizobium liaoningense]
MTPHEVDALRQQIERLVRDYPEIAEDELLRADMLDGETEIAEVLTSLIRMGEDARAMRDATKDQQANLKARADRFERRVEFTRALMLSILSAAELRKVELPEATVYLRHNPQQLVGHPDADKLPDDLVKVERKPDRAKIKEALKAGRVIEGMTLSNAAPSLTVIVR